MKACSDFQVKDVLELGPSEIRILYEKVRELYADFLLGAAVIEKYLQLSEVVTVMRKALITTLLKEYGELYRISLQMATQPQQPTE